MGTKSLEDNVQYVLDRFEIHDVLARYAAGQDDHQGLEPGTQEAWANVFTDLALELRIP
jgi:hypothetical protein